MILNGRMLRLKFKHWYDTLIGGTRSMVVYHDLQDIVDKAADETSYRILDWQEVAHWYMTRDYRLLNRWDFFCQSVYGKKFGRYSVSEILSGGRVVRRRIQFED